MIYKQPNQKYCLCGWSNEGITRINMTEQDVIDYYIENAKQKAKEDMEKCEGLGSIIQSDYRYGHNVVTDEILKQMGLDVTKAELAKFVKLAPKEKTTDTHDLTTYAKCPSCNGTVMSGWGGTEEKCNKCGQLLDWDSFR